MTIQDIKNIISENAEYLETRKLECSEKVSRGRNHTTIKSNHQNYIELPGVLRINMKSDANGYLFGKLFWKNENYNQVFVPTKFRIVRELREYMIQQKQFAPR